MSSVFFAGFFTLRTHLSQHLFSTFHVQQEELLELAWLSWEKLFSFTVSNKALLDMMNCAFCGTGESKAALDQTTRLRLVVSFMAMCLLNIAIIVNILHPPIDVPTFHPSMFLQLG